MKRVLYFIFVSLSAYNCYSAQQPLVNVPSLKTTSELRDLGANVQSNINIQGEMNDELYTLLGQRPWVIQGQAPTDTTLLWFDNLTSPGFLILKAYNGSTWVSQTGGIISYLDLADKPTIPTLLSQLNVDSANQRVSTTEKTTWNAKQNALGFVPENIASKGIASGYASLDAGGKVPTSQLPATSGLTSLPTLPGQSIVSTAPSTYNWSTNIPLSTNPSGILNETTGVFDLSGFQLKDGDLDTAASVSGSGLNKYFGTNDQGTTGVYSLPAAPIQQIPAPTSSSEKGIYCSTETSKCYMRFASGMFEIPSTYVPDPILRTLIVTTPTNGVITCNDSDLTTPINCGGANLNCTSTVLDNAVITGMTATPNSSYSFSSWSGDFAGTLFNDGTVTMNADKSGTAIFALSSGWLIYDDFSTNSISSYTKFSGSGYMAVNTTTGTISNTQGVGVSAWYYRNDLDLMSANQVVTAKIQDRPDSTSGASTGIVLRSNGTTGHGCWIDTGSDRFTCEALGGSGVTIYKSWTDNAWVEGAAHVVQISVGSDNIYKFEVDFNDDGDFNDVNEQVGNSAANASYTGTRVGIGSRVGGLNEVLDDFKAKVLQ